LFQRGFRLQQPRPRWSGPSTNFYAPVPTTVRNIESCNRVGSLTIENTIKPAWLSRRGFDERLRLRERLDYICKNCNAQKTRSENWRDEIRTEADWKTAKDTTVQHIDDDFSLASVMRTLGALIGYGTAVVLLISGLAAGSAWLARPDPMLKADARLPVVPQKILDSIERKKPVPIDVGPVRPAEGAQPVMQEAPASLPQRAIGRETIRVLSAPSSKARTRQRTVPPVAAQNSPVPAQRSRVISTRTDFPY